MIFLIIKDFIYKYKYYFIAVIFIATAIALFSFSSDDDRSTPVVVGALEKEEQSEEKEDLETYSVDVKGAVKSPGVYKVVKGSNVNDVIELAGGLKSNATTVNINLSKKVTDEMVIYIYTKTEYNKLNNETKNKSVASNNAECKSSTSTADITSCIKDSESTIISNNSPAVEETSSNELSNTSLVNINTASKEELLSLTGIGESKADCIIAYRTEVGLFNTIEDIKNVSGIGDALFNKIKDQITV